MKKDIAALCAALADECDHIGVPTRQHVVGLVQRGTISRDEAEEWARGEGEEPFEREPDLVEFDPMGAPDWTLAMATAWAIWRTPDAVRRAWTPFLGKCLRWVSCNHQEPRTSAPGGMAILKGHDLVERPPVSPDDVRMAARTRVAMTAAQKKHPGAAGEAWESVGPEIDPEQIENSVVSALRAGVPLVARHGIAEQIDPHTWATLSPFTDGQGGPEDVHDRGGVVRFYRVRIERDAVLTMWPPKPRSEMADVTVVDESVPEATASVDAPDLSVRLPSAGRPSLAHLYEAEYRRRVQSGDTLGAEREAEVLRSWLSGQADMGHADLCGHVLPSVSSIKKNVLRWRRIGSARTKIGPK